MPKKQIQFTLVQEDDVSTLTAYKVPNFDDPHIVDSSHIKWDEILAGVLADKVETLDLINVATTLKNHLVSERLTVTNGRLYFDGDEVDDSLAEFVIKLIEAGDPNYDAYVKFAEKVYSNPQAHSRQHLFSYLKKYDVSITTEGDLLLYKGVDRALETETFGGQKPYRSGSAGPANVSGYDHKSGKVPQAVGDIVSMPRSETWLDPSVACSTGLHVATWGYWHNGYGVNLLVIVNPRDVVSVPHDDAKIRCCRYKIVDAEVVNPVEDLVVEVIAPPVPTFKSDWDKVEPEPEVEVEEYDDDDDFWDDVFEDLDDIFEEDGDEDTEVTAVTISPTGYVSKVVVPDAEIFAEKRSPTEDEWVQSKANARNQKKGHVAYLKRLSAWTLVDGAGGTRWSDWLVNN
jgi:hypothetical protein